MKNTTQIPRGKADTLALTTKQINQIEKRFDEFNEEKHEFSIKRETNSIVIWHTQSGKEYVRGLRGTGIHWMTRIRKGLVTI